jgi:hypothetical protein
LNVRADLIRTARKSLCFHDFKNRLRSDYRHFAYARFSIATREVDRTPSFEIWRKQEARPNRIWFS